MERKPTFSSSSSSSLPPAKRFDVFLSFRGEDTRNNFTGHLSSTLRKIGLFNIFKDDYALEKGKDIGPELKKAIEDSQYAVVVLSENYATSSWCLRELAKIVKCAGNDSLKIRTIFYHINPSDVRNVKSTDERKQKGSFWEAMEAHKQNPSNSEKTLEKWRNALVTVANQSGYPVEAHTDEAIFIRDFVAKISSELGASIKSLEGLFGITSRLKELDSYVLQSSSSTNNVCFIGIHGMGGIGKSTLARAYYKQTSHQFDGSSFLQNVREVCEKKANGLVDLQRQLLSNILKGDFADIGHVDNGIDMIRSRLCRKKVLIVLDDVSKEEQLIALAEEDKWFGSGSIIIVTSREDSFLKIRRYAIYRAEYLNPREALQLFSSKAFRSIEPPKEYKKLSDQVVEYASYLPLALTVLGSLLGSKKTSEWECALRRLRKCPEKEIVEKLKISFDDLTEDDQRIFLDIACFFNGDDKDNVIEILDSCGFDSKYAISNLIDKSLLKIQNDKNLWMHDLLQEMGKGIVRKESGNELGRHSRIWDAADLYHILENKEGTDKVEAIVTTLEGTEKISFEGFSHMKKLRLLMIWDSRNFSLEHYEPKLEHLSNDLRFLQWYRFPYKKFSSSFLSKWKVWNNHIMEPFYNLKVIEVTYSASFSKFEDYSVVPNLEKLILEGCSNLLEIHPSIKHLQKLILLNLKLCSSLKKIPKEINGLASLQVLNLYGCFRLRQFLNNTEQLKSLRMLDIRETDITHLPSSIILMENLESLYCSDEEILQSAIRESIIKRTIGNGFSPGSIWTSLTRLDLIDCNLTGEAFPDYFGKLVCLEYLNLSKNPFSVLPTGIHRLPVLKYLYLEYCERLQCLEPELLPSSLVLVSVNYCTSLSSFLDPLKPCHLRCSAFCVDCTELVKRQDGTMTALASLRRSLEGLSDKRLMFEIVLPLLQPRCDHRLPAWFIKQSSTASRSIKLVPNRPNISKLIGLAMVFCFGANSSTDNFFCNIRARCDGYWETICDWNVRRFGSRRSDHLYLLFRPLDDLPINFIQKLESPSCYKLEFSFASYRDDCLCGPCGVRLVYEEDRMEILNEITCNYSNESPDEKVDVMRHSSHSTSISGSDLDSEEDLELVENQDSKNTTILTLERLEQDLSNLKSKIDIVIPGSEILERFGKNSWGPSISTKLYPNWCNSEWMGIALVACFGANSSLDNLYCAISFVGENLKVSKESTFTQSGSSENTWLLYLTRDYFPTTWLDFSFEDIEFSFHALASNENSCCRRCGVHLIYEKDIYWFNRSIIDKHFI